VTGGDEFRELSYNNGRRIEPKTLRGLEARGVANFASGKILVQLTNQALGIRSGVRCRAVSTARTYLSGFLVTYRLNRAGKRLT
jgi:hypothetical protein